MWRRRRGKIRNLVARLDEKFSHSPEVSGYRFLFWTESARGVFYVSKEAVGNHPPNEITLTMSFKNR